MLLHLIHNHNYQFKILGGANLQKRHRRKAVVDEVGGKFMPSEAPEGRQFFRSKGRHFSTKEIF